MRIFVKFMVFSFIFIINAQASDLVRFKGDSPYWSDKSGWWDGQSNMLPDKITAAVIPSRDSTEDRLTIANETNAAAESITLGSKNGYELMLKGGSLNVAENFTISNDSGFSGILTLDSGSLAVGKHLCVGDRGQGLLKIKSGEIHVSQWFVVGQHESSNARAFLEGGKITCGSIGVGKQGKIDIANGVLELRGRDMGTEIRRLIRERKLVAHGGSKDYKIDIEWDGKSTLVKAVPAGESNYIYNENGVGVITPKLQGKPLRTGKPVGFVIHPNHKAFEDRLDALCVNAELSNIFLWRMLDRDNLVVDTEAFVDWLKGVYESGRQAYPILDTSVFHSGGWRAEKTTEAGQFLTGSDGKIWEFKQPDGSRSRWSSLYSPIFRESVFNYIDQLIDWIKVNDHDHRIPGYLNGAEWFMPATVDYNPLGISIFKDRLKEKYGSLEMLNRKWGADFESWDQVDPPRGTLLGYDYTGIRTAGFDTKSIKACWSSEPIEIQGGRDYKIQVKVRQFGIPEGLCAVRLKCYNEAGAEIKYVLDGQFYWTWAEDGQWDMINETCRTPANAVKATLELLINAPGRAEFKDVSVSDLAGRQLLADGVNTMQRASGLWEFTAENNIGTGKIVSCTQDPENAMFVVEVPQLDMPYINTSLAWEYWITFCYEQMAHWLNICAEHIKDRDPDRKVVSYIGAASSTHYLGDFNTYWQRLDISLANSPAIDVNGIQLSFAGDDVTCTTCPIDIARKYGKDIYATDMVDFPYGLYSGFGPAYRAVMAGVQHGMDGMFCYSWFDPVVPDYNFSTFTDWQLDKFTQDVKTSVELLKGYTLETDAAFLLPVMSYSLADKGGYKSDWVDMAGAYHLVLDSGYLPDVFTPYELEKTGFELIRDYKVIFMPDCPVLGEKANNLLCQFVSSGGHIIGSGRVPRENLTYEKLEQLLINPDKSFENVISSLEQPYSIKAGNGRVTWINSMLGEKYMGPVRRWTEAGNTPPPLMRLDNSRDAKSLRRAIRLGLKKVVDETQPGFAAELISSKNTVHFACYQNPSSQLLFLLNQHEGRTRDVKVASDYINENTKAEIWLDFDQKIAVESSEKGVIEIPSFSDVCIVTLKR
ncbi:hypothetical protein SMSP2_01846 [Limihaloglobus sulfuriphilus]|uniref:Glycoside hydrolase family 42 N-terminal domain-containing protein n=1 Tax=Limihaloglobus sulfuriphilus TaxID=1851148 RepID=A0A1Q2MGS5_9BACT|nr:beta-galactosidase [Limihaloglobus sulfuriphilus]AQQ71472.1 hypothetical protein SMSP2_01846 [Limihaloglobus sulfuriphilus]